MPTPDRDLLPILFQVELTAYHRMLLSPSTHASDRQWLDPILEAILKRREELRFPMTEVEFNTLVFLFGKMMDGGTRLAEEYESWVEDQLEYMARRRPYRS